MAAATRSMMVKRVFDLAFERAGPIEVNES